MPSGYLIRDVWIDVCQRLGELTDKLDVKKKEKMKVKKESTKANDEEMDDFDKFEMQMSDF